MEPKKIKVAMICHFSNSEVRSLLPLSGRFLFGMVRKLLRLPGKHVGYSDIAPWDSHIINCVKERNDIDLYVLSAHGGLKKHVVSFELKGIHYSFLQCEFANLLKYIIPFDGLWRRINPLNYRVKRLIKSISPDLVLLVGTENAYYSSTVLAIKNLPIYVLCQTVYNNPEFRASNTWSSKNASTELAVINKVHYMAVYCRKHYDLLRAIGYKDYIFSFNWPVPTTYRLTQALTDKKDYDFVNFALHMSSEKGYHDCIRALAIVKKKYPKVSLCLVDGGNDETRKELKELILSLDLINNVTFIPFFPKREDLFQFLQTVRFAVLPCKVDHVSGTQIQSMELGLPVVCYKTTGTPSLNKDNQCVLIAEMNDVAQLAEKMLALLDNKELADQLRINAWEYTKKRQATALGNMQRLVDNFHAIVNNYRLGVPIPQEQLFENLN